MTAEVTTMIVNGYASNKMSPLSSNNNSYYNISNDLIKLIVAFIVSFVEKSGFHRVAITDPNVVNKMLNAECEEKFESRYISFISY